MTIRGMVRPALPAACLGAVASAAAVAPGGSIYVFGGDGSNAVSRITPH